MRIGWSHRSNERLRRLAAAGCIALVFALGVFAASPSLHALLHQCGQSLDDDGCAVVLFANGVSAPLAMIAVPPAPAEWQEWSFSGSTNRFRDSARYRLPPGRGPPLG